jgi:NhaP-type Na+/H+ or K+/H+ antiporter
MLLISLLFVLLAADLNLPLLWGALGKGLALFAVLALVVRPLSVWLSSRGSDLTWKQVLFIGAIAPRGVVAAAIVSLFAIILQDNGRTDAQTLQSLVYIIIIVSVMV